MDRKMIFGVLLGVTLCMLMGAADDFRWAGREAYQLTGPPTGIITCVQHDTTHLAVARRARLNAAGTCKFGYIDGTTSSDTYVAGDVVDGLINQVYDTGTSIADADIRLYK